MKRRLHIAILLLLTLCLGGCKPYAADHTEVPIALTAFNSLPAAEQDLIPTSPKDSEVKKVRVDDEWAQVVGQTYVGKEVYAVIFHHTRSASKGNITVYVDLDQKTIVGKGFSE